MSSSNLSPLPKFSSPGSRPHHTARDRSLSPDRRRSSPPRRGKPMHSPLAGGGRRRDERDSPRRQGRSDRRDRGPNHDASHLEGVPESQRFGKRGGRPNSANDSPVGPPVKREEPNFKVSGALAADQNTFKGVVLKYSEPAEARRPKERYRLYVFKGKEQIDMLHIHRQSAFLIGRERRVADIPVDHPSCSSQHAAIQYRQIVETDPLGQATRTVKPYLIDLDSSNGTYINGSQVPPSRYVELKVGDSIKFGYSSRDYVLMCEDMVEDD